MNKKHYGSAGFSAGIMLAVLVFSSCAKSPEAREAKFVAAGKQYFEKKDYLRAIIQFKNAAAVKRSNADVYYQLGLAYIGLGDYRSAHAAFSKAVDLDPKHVQAQIKKAEIEASSTSESHRETAANSMRKLVAQSPDNADALSALAMADWQLGNRANAEGELMQVLRHAPQDIQASLNLAAVKYMEKDMAGAETVMKQAAAANPKSPVPLLALGDLYRLTGKPQAAEPLYQQALQLDPNNGTALLSLANLYSTTNRLDLAEKLYRRVSALPDANNKPVYAMFLFDTGKREQAIAEFERLAKEDPSDRKARTRLVEAYLAVGKLSNAEKLLNAAIQKNASDREALLQRSRLYLAARNYEGARRDVGEALHQDANSAQAHYVLARIHQAAGQPLAQRQELGEALRLNPSWLGVRLELAHLLLTTSGPKAALNVLEEVKDVAPAQQNSLAYLIERNWALWGAGDMAEMRKQLDFGLAQGRAPKLLVQDGMWKLKAGKTPEARRSLEEALKQDPQEVSALALLANSYIAQKDTAKAIAVAEEYAGREPKSATMQQFLGNLLMTYGKLSQARTALNASLAADPRFEPALLTMAQLDVVEGKWDAARSQLKAVLGMDSKNATARVWMGVIEEANRNYEGALKYYREALDADPNNAEALNNAAYLLVDHANQPDEALKYAQRAVELRPGKVSYEDTLGWVLYRKGLYTVAVPHLEQAAAQKGSVVPKYHLAMAYAKSGERTRSRTVLDAALKLNPNVPEAQMAKQVVGESK